MQKSFTRISLMVFLILIVSGTLFAAVQGFLAVEAIDGVQVYVNGEMKGITVGGSSVLMLDPGSYRITLEKEGYSSTSQTVTIKAGEATNLKVNMTKPQVRGEALGADDKTVVLGQKTGTVEIRSVPFRDADILINGVNYGKTDRRLTSFPIGRVNVVTTYQNKRLTGVFHLEENDTMFLQANYALEHPAIIQLFDVRFSISNDYPYSMGQSQARTLQDILPEGFYMELEGEYAAGVIGDIRESIRVQGANHTVRYTNGNDYLDFKQEISLTRSGSVSLEVPQLRIESLSFEKPSIELGVDNSLPLTVDIHPIYMDGSMLTWSSSDDSIIDITQSGIITAKASGESVITVWDKLSGITDSIKVVSRIIPVEKVQIQSDYDKVEVGKELQLVVHALPEGASRQVEWSSSDEKIAAVSQDGIITGISEGTVTITGIAEHDATIQDSMLITVFKIPVTGIRLNTTSIRLPAGISEQLTGTIIPGNATNKTIIWSSKDPTVTTVDENGKITIPLSASTGSSTEITATSADNDALSAVAVVTVFSYQMGSTGPAGGLIFYDKGFYSDGWRYLEAAPKDYDFYGVWGGYQTSVGGTGTAIGTGKENTEKIVAKFGNAEPYKNKTDYAAKLCADLVVIKDGVRYDDWFLPSKDELNLMYQNLYRNKLGGFSGNYYWSSSEGDAYHAWYQYFSNGNQGNGNRYFDFRVRPVRAF